MVINIINKPLLLQQAGDQIYLHKYIDFTLVSLEMHIVYL